MAETVKTVLVTGASSGIIVTSWISLQYYGSTVTPEAFGAGNKR